MNIIFDYANDIVILGLFFSNIILLIQNYHYRKYEERCKELIKLGEELKDKLVKINELIVTQDTSSLKSLLNAILQTSTTILTLLSNDKDKFEDGERL